MMIHGESTRKRLNYVLNILVKKKKNRQACALLSKCLHQLLKLESHFAISRCKRGGISVGLFILGNAGGGPAVPALWHTSSEPSWHKELMCPACLRSDVSMV